MKAKLNTFIHLSQNQIHLKIYKNQFQVLILIFSTYLVCLLNFNYNQFLKILKVIPNFQYQREKSLDLSRFFKVIFID